MTADGRQGEADAGGPIRLGRLGDALGYRLRLAQNASFQAFSRLAGDAGLRPGLYALLHLIRENPGVSQTAVSCALGRDKSTLTPILIDAERRGLVRREVDPADRRGRRLTLTRAGHDKLRILADCADRHEARLDALLTPEQRGTIVSLLDILTDGLEGRGRGQDHDRPEEP